MPDTALLTSPSATNSENHILHRTSHVLDMIAGPWSQQLAEQFPFPHKPLLSRSSCWLHLCGLVLSHPNLSNSTIHTMFAADDWRQASWLACPHLTPESGNLNIIRKLLLPLWSKQSYRRFRKLLSDDNATSIMKFSAVITPDLVDKTFYLCPALRHKKLVDFLIDSREAKLIASLFNERSNDELITLGRTLKNMPNRKCFWNKIEEYFLQQVDTFETGPQLDDPRVESIRTVRALHSFGKSFRNCISSFQVECIAGEQAFYVFTSKAGEKAMIGVVPRLNGKHCITEIKGIKNNPVSTSTMEEIRKLFLAHGFSFEEESRGYLINRLDHDLQFLSHHDDPSTISKRIDRAIEHADRLQMALRT